MMKTSCAFEATISGELKKFAAGDTISKEEAEEIDAESKGLIEPKKPTKAKPTSEGEKEDAKS